MKHVILIFGFLTSAAAFANPSYSCGSLNKDGMHALTLTLGSSKKSVQITPEGANLLTLNEDKTVEAPSGYTAFTGTVGCPQHTPLTCKMIEQVVLMVEQRLLDGAVQGDVVYNNESLRCNMQMLEQ